MEYFGYISAVYENHVRELDIHENDLDFFVQELFKFELFHGAFSTYKIYSRLKQRGDSIAYKNVHQKVHKILSLGLIEEVSEKGGFHEHGAKYYQISLNGWVNLILKGALNYAPSCKRAIRINYDKNIIFKTFLYPFFKIETLLTFTDLEIGAYLMDCCVETIHNIETWEPDNERVFGIPREKLLGLSKQKLREVLEDKLYKSTKTKVDLLLSPGLRGDKKLIEILEEETERKTKERGKYSNIEFIFDPSLPKEKWSEVSIVERPHFQTVNVVDAISDSLDSQVNRFLIDLIITTPKKTTKGINARNRVLAYDEKFMTAAQGLEEKFLGSYHNLTNLKTENDRELAFSNSFPLTSSPSINGELIYLSLRIYLPLHLLVLFGF